MSESDNRRYYLSRGRCPSCGGKNPVIEGHTLCIDCKRVHDEGQDKRRELWRDTGRCTRCGRERDDWHKMCSACRAYMSDIKRQNSFKAKQRRDRLRAKGFCTRCGETWAEPGHAWCKRCAERHNADTRGEEYRAKVNARRQERREAGLCIDCGSPSLGRQLCPKCAEARRESAQKYRILQRIKREVEEARRANASCR